MLVFIIALLGLVVGSFINALVWRLRQQEKGSKKYSILSGRSVCPHCKHQLAAKDLVPLFSWLFLNGKCRYCSKPISRQYPLIELLTAFFFVFSYLFWPYMLTGNQVTVFMLWLPILTILIALSVYDLKWYTLPTKLIYISYIFAIPFVILSIYIADYILIDAVKVIGASLIGGGLFYLIYQLSKGKWIGGGDVRLGWLLGLFAMTPAKSILFIFIASLLGTAIAGVMILINKSNRHKLIPFGPYLIAGLYLTVLFGTDIISWYTSKILGN